MNSFFGMTYKGVNSHYKFEQKEVQKHEHPDVYLRSYIDEENQHWDTFRSTMKTQPVDKYRTQLKLHWAHSVPPRIAAFNPTHPSGKQDNIDHRIKKGDYTFESSDRHLVPPIIDNRRATSFNATLPSINGQTLENTRAIPTTTTRPITTEHTSGIKYRAEHQKQRRLQNSPTNKYMRPLTSSNAIGWHHTNERMEENRTVYLPKKSCEVTKYASTMIKSNHH